MSLNIEIYNGLIRTVSHSVTSEYNTCRVRLMCIMSSKWCYLS